MTFSFIPPIWAQLALLFALLFFQSDLGAQDIRFSQYYQAPIYLNPSFTGAESFGRVGINHRIQGTGSLSTYYSSSAFVDYNFRDYQSSVGLMAVSDRDEYSGYRYVSIAVPYSYEITVNDRLVLRSSLQASYNSQNMDAGRFLFSDQLDANGNVVGGTAEPLLAGDMVSYFDVASGVLAYTRKIWLGFAAHNLVQNNISIVQDGESILKRRYSVHGGYSIRLKNASANLQRKVWIMPTFNFSTQGGFSSLDAGFYAFADPILLGVFSRDVPVVSANNTYLTLVAGAKKFNFTFGYSYDIPISGGIAPGGIHELSVTYLFDLSDPVKPPLSARRLKCPLIN